MLDDDADSLATALAAATEKWKSLPLQTDEERDNATRFYDGEVFPLLKKMFTSKHQSLTKEPVFGLILSVGTSPEPLILSISALKPQRVLFLCTEQTEECLDRIVDETGLKPRQWDKRLIDSTNPLNIYQQIQKIYEHWGQRRDIVIDITGGTKSMSGGAAMACALIGGQLAYVKSKYLRDRRRPDPGSEQLVFLPNPYEVFGAAAEQMARDRFGRCDYAGAAMILGELAQKVPMPKRFEALQSVACAYQAWNDLNIKEACRYLDEAISRLAVLCQQGTDSQLARLELFHEVLPRQRELLQHLAGLLPVKPKDSALSLLQDLPAVKTLIYTLAGNAARKEERDEYDTAALLLYRLVEIMEQRRLATYGVDSAHADYACLGDKDPQALLGKINSLKEALDQDERLSALPEKIDLATGYMLLEALGDDFNLAAVGIKWKGFLNQTQARNFSMLAHGFIFISRKQYGDFKKMVEKLLARFCALEGIERPDACAECAFINPWADAS